MTDLVKLFLQAGDGGDGKVSFRREYRVPKGGPDGGDGGDGGSVIIEGDRGLATLDHLAGKTSFVAQEGVVGGRRRKTGARGKDLVIKVPLGTQVSVWAENKWARDRRMTRGPLVLWERQDADFKIYQLERATDKPGPRPSEPMLEAHSGNILGESLNSDTGLSRRNHSSGQGGEPAKELPSSELVKQADPRQSLSFVEIKEHAQKVVVCQGGFGGRGNDAFKGSTRTTPLIAEYGTSGERRVVVLELKLLADVGLVGLPNAGKSTLLSVLTKARPKIANYPFTTLKPHLGVLEGLGSLSSEGLIIADIPGLIEGASEGKGLGHDFLRHVENCQALAMVLFLEESLVYDEKTKAQQKARALRKQLRAVLEEVKKYRQKLSSWDDKKMLIVINKIDLYNEELRQAIEKEFGQEIKDENFFLVSGATHEGIKDLREAFSPLS